MPTLYSEGDWAPAGINELEPNADLVVRSSDNRLVVAGPGAGKTELLAQRANFLLETGRCPSPKRILAISFKRDAAKNLEARVRERCIDYADRFDSFTLDAFAKRIIDRFLPALPEEWRPAASYQVRTNPIPRNEAEEWLNSAIMPEGVARPFIQNWSSGKVKNVMDLVIHGVELPYAHSGIDKTLQTWGLQWWHRQLSLPGGSPSLTFPMLNRLASFLLRCNPKVLTCLQLTYAYVFLDEFQDTTASQWDLIKSAFLGSKTILTAVGDGKQRIMVWAGAKTDVFEKYQEEFSAIRVDLVRNYRSVPELVRMQHIIAQALDESSVATVAASPREKDGICELREYRDPEQEAELLADLISKEVESGFTTPRDYCVLVRQRVGDMVALLKHELGAKGILLRDESALQDLRAEPLTTVVLSSLRLGTKKRDAKAWEGLVAELMFLSGLDPENNGQALEQIVIAHKTCVIDELATNGNLKMLPLHIVELLGAERYKSTYRQYVNGDYLNKTAKDLGDLLQTSFEDMNGDARLVPDDIIGVNVLPAMTIHKSKGLEFSTVIFLGLEDAQWWGLRNQPDEEKRAFFVAFSRAIERVLFTWSDQRDGPNGRQRQRRQDVTALHDILAKAGVPTVDFRTKG